MKHLLSIFILGLFALVSIPIVSFFIEKDPISIVPSATQVASAHYFRESVSLAQLQQRFNKLSRGSKQTNDRIKILIVPGHTDTHPGAVFNGLREVELNRLLGTHLYNLLIRDDAFTVVLSADVNGPNKRIEQYLEQEAENITEFQAFQKRMTAHLEEQGKLSLNQFISHNTAPGEVAQMLYGLNKYANDEKFDIVLHIHFNDYPGRPRGAQGKYEGFSIYVPEASFSNGRASKAFANHLFEQLKKIVPVSTHPIESIGVIEDSELIAVGAFNTVDPIALLVEYGFIYEPQYQDPQVRDVMVQELAYQTYVGVKSFFDASFAARAKPTTLLPFEWRYVLQEGDGITVDIVALEALLVLNGFQDPQTCIVDGIFDACTAKALRAFQKHHGLRQTGSFDTATRQFVQTLF